MVTERERERAVRAGGERQSDALMVSTLNAFFCMLEMLKCCRTGVRGQMSDQGDFTFSQCGFFFTFQIKSISWNFTHSNDESKWSHLIGRYFHCSRGPKPHPEQ